jgi:hypothetical protein
MRSIRLLVLACLPLVMAHIRPVNANPSMLCGSNGSTCTVPSNCCSTNCDTVTNTCECEPDGYSCTQNSQCCTGSICNSSYLCGACGTSGAPCNRNSDCCISNICTSDHTCELCGIYWDYCGASSDCCAGSGALCVENSCCITNGNYDHGDQNNCCSLTADGFGTCVSHP